MGVASRYVEIPAQAVSEVPQSGARLRAAVRAQRPALGYTAIALGFVMSFWTVACASDWFVDAPFVYTTSEEWSQNLIKSVARSIRPEEAALFIAALFAAVPAVLFLALQLRQRRARPWRALEQFAARDSVHFTALFAAVAVLLAWLGFRFVLGGSPLIDDERSYAFAARNLASGSFLREAMPAAFRNPMVLTTPAWISKYPPGFAALLTPGVRLGLPRLMPSLVCGLSIAGMFQLAKSLFGLRTAVLATVLWTFSPFQLAIASTTMIFGTSGCLALWSAALVARALLGRDSRALYAAAALGALHVLVRPFDAGLVLTTSSLVIASFYPRPAALRRLAVLGAGFGLGLLALAAFNWRVFGSALSSGYTSAGDYHFGFFVHSLPGFAYEHTPVQALAHVIVAIARLDGWLVGVPGVLLLATLVLIKPSRRERALLLGVAVHLIGYSTMASSGTFDVGPTYYYLVAPCYLLLAIRGGLRVQMVLGRKHRHLLAWASLVVIPVAWLTVVPMKAMRLKALASAIDAPWAFLAASNLNQGLVIVPPFKEMRAAGYGLGYPYEVATRTGALHLVRPLSAQELADAARALHYTGPVYRLDFDEAAFQADGSRSYGLQEFARVSDVSWPSKAAL